MTVFALGSSPVVARAGRELVRVLGRMTGSEPDLVTGETQAGRPGLYVTAQEHAPVEARAPEVATPAWDDAYALTSMGDSLFIVGSNPRSALIGAYAYLRTLGAEWLWPGETGEHLPRVARVPLTGYAISSVAASRHRGICMEGAPSLEHVLDLVDWMPRVGLNSYFLQFRNSSCFWRDWYGHASNPCWEERRELTEEECEELDARVVEAVKARGLLLHRVGHGWTAAALGMPTDGWEAYRGPLDEAECALTAEVDGDRGVWRDCPTLTELCYSNPEARRRLLEVVLEYAGAHPEVDILHLWLSDGTNNTCECPDCRALSPSDWYVTLLNELSPRLARLAPHMKVAFLAYLNTLWPPTQVALNEVHDNLVYMFAPITRCYGHQLSDPDCGDGAVLSRPELNRLTPPRDNRANWRLLELWEAARPADSFAYDYHFFSQWADGLSVQLADVLVADLADYAHQGLRGVIHCSPQRAFYPNGWAYYAAAGAAWGPAPGEAEHTRYLRLAYGLGAEAAGVYLRDLPRVAGCPLHGESWPQASDDARTARMLEWLAGQEAPLRTGAAAARGLIQEQAWRLLLHHHRLLTQAWQVVHERRRGHAEAAGRTFARLERFVQETEPETASALDTFILLQNLRKHLG